MKKIRIKTPLPWIAYPGTPVQQNYAEDVTHGYLNWEIEDRNKYAVSFKQLPNPKPFVTIDWKGTAEKTYKVASKYPRGSRFRVKSAVHVAQQEIQALTTMLKQSSIAATEVTFKIDQQVNKEALSAGAQTLARADLRNPDVLLLLVRNYHVDGKHVDDVWQRVGDQIKVYLAAVSTADESVRNTKWSLRSLKFHNMFSYGENNFINFDNLNGIVGIFGPNRSGKSSIVGTIMYSLFNTTDRGSMKNLYVCNVRKPYCYSRAVITVNGIDYVIERQTTKHETKKGIAHATTALNLFRMNEDGEAVDLAGEQRFDTEKAVRNLIGNSDDFLLTSLSAQGENNGFIQHGSARRRQILSRFLDLDVFDKMYDLANKDVNTAKAQFKMYPENDWNVFAKEYKQLLDQLTSELAERITRVNDATQRLADLRAQLARHSDFTPVSKTQVDAQQKKVAELERQLLDVQARHESLLDDVGKAETKVKTIEGLCAENDMEELKKRLSAYTALEASVVDLKHSHEKEATVLKQQERSLKILDDVPCGDQFQTCKFIKDAHVVKGKIEGQRERSSRALEKLAAAMSSLQELKKENVKDKVEKLQKLQEMHTRLAVDLSNKKTELVRLENAVEGLALSLEPARARLLELEEALKNEENAEVVSLRSEIDSLVKVLSVLDTEKMSLAARQGRAISDIEKASEEKKSRDLLLQKMKVFELIASAFSRRGIPNIITSSQLPVINVEIAKILAGIVDFTLELEVDEESDSMDVYINYGDSRRIIELSSGMEKMISSIAIRVALINVSALPKTDTFIIDEGFGALDGLGAEACNRLLSSLKRYFKTVIVITHVDSVKDAADNVLEITKSEKDSRIVHE